MKKILGIASAVVTIAALVGVSSASFYVFYQPKVPKSLK